eukprot:SAG31_NODE_5355_length_2591_cov_2.022472_1_plen_125_part_00
MLGGARLIAIVWGAATVSAFRPEPEKKAFSDIDADKDGRLDDVEVDAHLELTFEVRQLQRNRPRCRSHAGQQYITAPLPPVARGCGVHGILRRGWRRRGYRKRIRSQSEPCAPTTLDSIFIASM